MTSAQRNEYRLTAADETAMLCAARALNDEWGDPLIMSGRQFRALEQAGARAIGCTLDSLRDSERAWLHDAIQTFRLAS